MNLSVGRPDGERILDNVYFSLDQSTNDVYAAAEEVSGARLRLVSPSGEILCRNILLLDVGLEDGALLMGVSSLEAGTYKGVYNDGRGAYSYVKIMLEISPDLTYILSSSNADGGGRKQEWKGELAALEAFAYEPDGKDVAVWIDEDG